MSLTSQIVQKAVKSGLQEDQRNLFLEFAGNPIFWLRCALFFIAATPFEGDRSGFTFLVRFCCIVILLLSVALRPHNRIQLPNLVVVLVLISLLLANFVMPSFRALQAIALIFATASLAQIMSPRWNRELSAIILIYLLVNSAGLVVQIAALRTTGVLLDLHGMIFPSAARIEFIGQYGRLSGFHNEPGTYSQWMLMTLFLRSLITRNIINPINVVVSLTIAATVSLWGVVGAVVYALAAIMEAITKSRVSTRIKQVGLLALLSLSIAGVTATLLPGPILRDSIAFLQIKASITNQSGFDKVRALASIERDFPDVIWLGKPVTPGFCTECLAPNDIGIWANGIYYFGFIVMAVLLGALALGIVQGWGIAFLPLLGMLLVWKAPFYDPSLWMIIGIVLAKVRLLAPSFARQNNWRYRV